MTESSRIVAIVDAARRRRRDSVYRIAKTAGVTIDTVKRFFGRRADGSRGRVQFGAALAIMGAVGLTMNLKPPSGPRPAHSGAARPHKHRAAPPSRRKRARSI